MIALSRLLNQPAPDALRVTKECRDLIGHVSRLPATPMQKAIRRMLDVSVPLSFFPSPAPARPAVTDSLAPACIAPRRAVPRTVNIELSGLDRDQRKALAEALLASIEETPEAPAAE